MIRVRNHFACNATFVQPVFCFGVSVYVSISVLSHFRYFEHLLPLRLIIILTVLCLFLIVCVWTSLTIGRV